MPIDKVVAPLLRVPLFVGLKPLQITEIARQAERIAFRAGSTITRSGTVGDGAYLIVSGEAVRMPEPGHAAQPEPIEPGSLIGELAMLVDHVYGATVVAQGRIHCLKILRTALYEQMQTDEALADHMINVLSARLRQVAADMRAIDEMLAPQQHPTSGATNAEQASAPCLPSSASAQP
jgi:CRP-like cAMP-binding protein